MPLSYNEGNFGKNLNKKTKSHPESHNAIMIDLTKTTNIMIYGSLVGKF